MAQPHRVVIVGGGFGGLYATQALREAQVQVTLVDRHNYQLFQPLVYQVATAALSAGDIAFPLRALLRKQKNAHVLLGTAVDLDVPGRKLILTDGEVPYDTLILAPGASHSYFGHDEWEPLAPGLKSLDDALEVRRRILLAFEAAERAQDPIERQEWLTFVVVGGGPTGVELAGAIAELARATLPGNFRSINSGDAQVFLLEGGERVLSAYPRSLSAKATRSLTRLGVTVHTNHLVTEITPDAVMASCGEHMRRIPARTALWAAGVQASPLGKVLELRAGATLGRSGRVTVEPDLTIPGHPEIFVIGDLASYAYQTGKPLAGLVQPAMQEGKYVAALIQSRLRGQTVRRRFHYHDKGQLAQIGKAAAVADLGLIRFGGFLAWLIWAAVHLWYIMVVENRLLIFLQWAWWYFTDNRAARLITGYPEMVRPVPGAVATESARVGEATDAGSRNAQVAERN
jgi:NADH dehydrogenase